MPPTYHLLGEPVQQPLKQKKWIVFRVEPGGWKFGPKMDISTPAVQQQVDHSTVK